MLNIIKHKNLGLGEVIGKEVKGNSTNITVRFENNSKEMRFVIPQSFEMGIIEAVGDFKDEVDTAIALKKERGNERINSAVVNSAPSSTGSRRPHKSKSIPNDIIAASYEEYLTKAGYSLETDNGDPSTVYVYVRAVESVLEKEHLSWEMLKNNISDIIPDYDEGGRNEDFGKKSNKPVINALKRFEDFVA